MRSHSPTSNMLSSYSTHVELWARVSFNMSLLPLWQIWSMSKLESNFKELSLPIYTGTNPSLALYAILGGMRKLSSGFLLFFFWVTYVRLNMREQHVSTVFSSMICFIFWGVLMAVYVIGFMHQVWFVNNVKGITYIFISTFYFNSDIEIMC